MTTTEDHLPRYKSRMFALLLLTLVCFGRPGLADPVDEKEQPLPAHEPAEPTQGTNGVKYTVNASDADGNETGNKTEIEMIFVEGSDDVARTKRRINHEIAQATAKSDKPLPITTIHFTDTTAERATPDLLEDVKQTDPSEAEVTVIEDEAPYKEGWRDNIGRGPGLAYDAVVFVIRIVASYNLIAYALVQGDNMTAADAAFVSGAATGAGGILHILSTYHARYLESANIFKMLPDEDNSPAEYKAELERIEERCKSPLYRTWYKTQSYLKDGAIIWVFMKIYWMAKVYRGAIDVPTTPMDWAYNEMLFLIYGAGAAMFVESGFIVWISRLISQEQKHSPDSRKKYLKLKRRTYFCLASIFLTAPQVMLAGVAKSAPVLLEIPSVDIKITVGAVVGFVIGASGFTVLSLEFSHRYRAWRDRFFDRARRWIGWSASATFRCGRAFLRD